MRKKNEQMILANGCNITKSEKFKGVWILSVPTVYVHIQYMLCHTQPIQEQHTEHRIEAREEVDSMNNVIRFHLSHFTVSVRSLTSTCVSMSAPFNQCSFQPDSCSAPRTVVKQAHISEVENSDSPLLADYSETRPHHWAKRRHIVKALKKRHRHAPIHRHTVWEGTVHAVYASAGLIAGRFFRAKWQVTCGLLSVFFKSQHLGEASDMWSVFGPPCDPSKQPVGFKVKLKSRHTALCRL